MGTSNTLEAYMSFYQQECLAPSNLWRFLGALFLFRIGLGLPPTFYKIKFHYSIDLYVALRCKLVLQGGKRYGIHGAKVSKVGGD